MERGVRVPPALLEEASRRDAAQGPHAVSSHGAVDAAPDEGDLVVMLLTSTLRCLRDRLHRDGFFDAAEFVADLVEIADDYLAVDQGWC